MADNRLIFLPAAIKNLQTWVNDREWNGELVTKNHYATLEKWRGLVKQGTEYEARF